MVNQHSGWAIPTTELITGRSIDHIHNLYGGCAIGQCNDVPLIGSLFDYAEVSNTVLGIPLCSL